MKYDNILFKLYPTNLMQHAARCLFLLFIQVRIMSHHDYDSPDTRLFPNSQDAGIKPLLLRINPSLSSSIQELEVLKGEIHNSLLAFANDVTFNRRLNTIIGIADHQWQIPEKDDRVIRARLLNRTIGVLQLIWGTDWDGRIEPYLGSADSRDDMLILASSAAIREFRTRGIDSAATLDSKRITPVPLGSLRILAYFLFSTLVLLLLAWLKSC